MSHCKMQMVRVNEKTRALMCDRCLYVTFDLDSRYCPQCGAEIRDVTEPEKDVFAMAERYAYDVGFDEEYQSAMQEVEDAEMRD